MTMHYSPLTAANGISIRQLWPAEQALFRAHFDKLDPASKAMRFGGLVHDSFIDKYVETAFKPGNMVFGAFVNADMVGVGEIKLLRDGLMMRAEAAFSVIPAWQHKGVGEALMTRIIAVLQNRGVRSVYLWCRSSNTDMRHLADKFGIATTFTDGDEIRAELELPWPMPSSIMEELLGEATGLAQSMMRMSQPAAAQTTPAGALPS